jgi:hypothetical protein
LRGFSHRFPFALALRSLRALRLIKLSEFQTINNIEAKHQTSNIKPQTSNMNQHVVKHPKGWAVKSAGVAKPTKVLPTQLEAFYTAREIARKEHSELFVHGRNGRIRMKNSYGSDSFPPKG